LQFADIRLATFQRGDTAAAHHSAILFHHPIGVPRLAVELVQLVQIGVRHGITFISGKTVFGRNPTNNGGNRGIIVGSHPA
jgi:hypothetical protein